eukprot:CAMPEP_0115852892 /NCGR_PEP_ID=MMETSP0287-20121206/13226_1 /TAXON_ID=412157 /ORGANISM="Chrysochromulina rotalis, Strain UIO044" /LENGTH=271 /DNA_ID=CAMNT_0003306959 /DNA_START=28 /DNA_END=843 /DNA_ORIENTATION=-
MPGFAGQMGVATIDMSAPSMKRLLKDRNNNLAPPIGASPGELRLWMKMNGLLEEPKAKKKPPAARRVPTRLPPIKTAAPAPVLAPSRTSRQQDADAIARLEAEAEAALAAEAEAEAKAEAEARAKAKRAAKKARAEAKAAAAAEAEAAAVAAEAEAAAEAAWAEAKAAEEAEAVASAATQESELELAAAEAEAEVDAQGAHEVVATPAENSDVEEACAVATAAAAATATEAVDAASSHLGDHTVEMESAEPVEEPGYDDEFEEDEEVVDIE